MRLSNFGVGALAAASLVGLVSVEANAAPKLRVQVSQHGDFVLMGNTLGHDCAPGTPAPVVGTVNANMCGQNVTDSAPDLFWRADSPMDGAAEANTNITVAQARSTSVLSLPNGASVTHAFLYWGATLTAPGTDQAITLDRPNDFMTDVAMIECAQSTNNSYQCVADVTDLVQMHGPGAYRVSGIDVAPVVNVNNNALFGGWWMVVLYQLPADPLRNLAVFDGLDPVANGAPQNATLSGFLVPNGGINGKLGLATYEGDVSINGDQFFFNGGQALTDAANPANNFFNSSRSFLGMPVTVAGDLPQLAGTAGSMSGIDLDVVDITNKLMAGQKSAPIQATSTGDVYYLAGFVTSVSDYRPDFTTSTKTVVDVNGGLLLPGDILEYTLTAINTGNDTAIDVVLKDPLPMGVTYVPNTLQVSAGPNMGAKTDALADDQGEYDMNTNTVTFRLGMGANGSKGGTIAVGASSEVKFQVQINPDTKGTIQNQGTITAVGLMGVEPADTPTDGNGDGQGSPPTDTPIDECETDADCTDPNLPICATDLDPNTCVQCLSDTDCGPLTPTCNVESMTCECIPSGMEVCDNADNDCNGMADEGFDLGGQCSVGMGECAADGVFVCNAGGDGTECGAMPGTPGVELCDTLDNDCDGVPDNNCVACAVDSDCGAPDSGKVCDASMCVDGCRGTGGNGCPIDLVCTSQDDTVGMCVPAGSTDSATAGSASDSASASATEGVTDGGASATATATDSATDSASATDSNGATASAGIDDEGIGCECNADDPRGGGLMLLGLAGLALGTRRRRKSA